MVLTAMLGAQTCSNESRVEEEEEVNCIVIVEQGWNDTHR